LSSSSSSSSSSDSEDEGEQKKKPEKNKSDSGTDETESVMVNSEYKSNFYYIINISGTIDKLDSNSGNLVATIQSTLGGGVLIHYNEIELGEKIGEGGIATRSLNLL
jgi:hypothetical protein